MIIRTQSEHWSSLLSNEDHYDTVLVGSDKVQVQVHSYLLARCSQVMSDLLIEHRSHHNSHPVTIIVQDMEVDDIRHILQLRQLLLEGVQLLPRLPRVVRSTTSKTPSRESTQTSAAAHALTSSAVAAAGLFRRGTTPAPLASSFR